MLQIKNVATDELIVVTPTIFPDGTSQVWKLGIGKSIRAESTYKVIWHFEGESELIHLLQLLDLMDASKVTVSEIFIPYLPYARQDKFITDETTFALHTFTTILRTYSKKYGFKVSTLDIHNKWYGIQNHNPELYINEAIMRSSADVLVFPDKGASERYHIPFMPHVILDKDRDQSTGRILGMKFSEETIHVEIEGKRILIVDDICDGGATFLGAARLLYQHEIDWLALYVTHGIFSKGFEHLIDGGFREFYTTQSLLKNVNGFPLTY